MIIVNIPNPTRILAENQEEYLNLPIIDVIFEDTNSMQSYWVPTRDELDKINKGFPIVLSVFGVVHPPVMLNVANGDDLNDI